MIRMWNSVIQSLEDRQAVVKSLPIKCDQHPEHEFPPVNEIGLLRQVSPQGKFTNYLFFIVEKPN